MALLLAYAYDARAGEVVSELTNEVFTSGTSCEGLPPGLFNPNQSDAGDPYGPYYWQGIPSEQLAAVTNYAPGAAAYDYEAHGLTRNPIFAAQGETEQSKYLVVDSQETVNRSIFVRDSAETAFSNVVVRTGCRESIYCDLVTQLSASEEGPMLDSNARIAVWVWVQENEDGGFVTNLMATAGCFTNGYTAVAKRDFRLDLTGIVADGVFDLSKWYRLTIRAHGDVSVRNAGLSGFSIYLDGKPVRALAEDYVIADPRDERSVPVLLPEARALQAERRFFPSLAKPGSDASVTVSGFSFVGECKVDDISFSSEDPGYGKPEAVFTVNWDTGFRAPLSYSLDGGETTNALPVGTALSRDILIGAAPTNGLTLRVTEFAYRDDLGFCPGVWLGSNGAVLTNGNEFVYGGSNRNPIATIASTRDVISVGPGGFDTFKSAFEALDRSTNAVKVLELTTNVLVSVSRVRDAYLNRDEGYVFAGNAAGNYVLDLNGHTLRGQGGKYPTLVVSCASLRIRDSSIEKTGRIQPVQDYTNANDRLNTSVLVFPQADRTGTVVEPVLTLQEGIYDGWIRNQGSVDGTNALTGVVFVEGGSYISTNATSFYLENCVTNPSAQFIYRDGYWSSCEEENLVIWSGLGDGRLWQDPDNWKSRAVPLPTETALFPSRAEGLPPWTVDVGSNGMTTAKLWLEGDVSLSGTNDFRFVTMRSDGLGRFCGDAMLVYDGDQPGRLTETTLRDDWAGTVLLKNVGYPTTAAPKTLRNLDTWGTAGSTVVFAGVRGYVMDTKSYTMPYDFVLVDALGTNRTGNVVTNLAWQNDSGYTGSTLTFLGALTGDGTFRSGPNVRAVLQLFKFADVQGFRGRFSVEGKRVLIGSETVMSSVAGLIAFGDHAIVSSGLGWDCRHAVFGSNLHVWGETNDVLVACTNRPDVSACALTLNGRPGIAWLACTNEPQWTVYVSGTPPPALDEPPLLASTAPDAVFATVSPSYATDTGYAGTALRKAAYALAVVAVQMADVSIDVREDEVSVVVSNASRGLWYGIRHRASLAEEWGAPTAWTRADGPTVTLTCGREAESGFYEVVVSYVDPGGGGTGD